MPNYGFVIDLKKCIGCHACSIACKAEHDIPVGVNRCWVKTVEKGTFPDTRRFFFPVLSNQCDEAPCAKICPTSALFRADNGVVRMQVTAPHRAVPALLAEDFALPPWVHQLIASGRLGEKIGECDKIGK